MAPRRGAQVLQVPGKVEGDILPAQRPIPTLPAAVAQLTRPEEVWLHLAGRGGVPTSCKLQSETPAPPAHAQSGGHCLPKLQLQPAPWQ